MKQVALLFDKHNFNLVEPYAEFLEGRGWEVFSPHSGIGSRTDSSTSSSYLHSSFDLILVFCSVQLAQNQKPLTASVHQAVKRNQKNLYFVSLDEDWQKLPTLHFVVDIAYFENELAQFSEYEASLEELEARGEEEWAFRPESARMLLNAMVAKDDVEHVAVVDKPQVHYEIFARKDALNEQLDYIVFLYNRSVLAASGKVFQQEHRPVIGKNPITIVRSSKTHHVSERQLKNVEKYFPGAKAKSFSKLVEDFASDTSSKDALIANASISLPEASIFVDYNCISDGDDQPSDVLSTIVNSINDAFSSNANSISVVLGEGGSGKSWSLKAGNRRLLEQGRYTTFIDARMIRTHASGDLPRIRSLYDVYRTYQQCLSASVLPKNLFELRILARPTIIIIDGIEEIKALLGDKFDISELLTDCIRISEGSSQVQIVMSSRFSFWDSDQEERVSTIRLLPFESDQIDEYFSRSFPTSGDRYKMSQTLTKKLVGTKQASLTPAMLETIVEIINRTDQSLVNDDYETDILDLDQTWDFLICAAIDRDREKLNARWSIDQWLIILSRLAAKTDTGPIKFENAKSVAADVLNRDLNDGEDTALSSHVLLATQDNMVSFRNIYYSDFFLALYIRLRILDDELDLFSNEDAQLFVSHIQPGTDLSERLRVWMSPEADIHTIALSELATQVEEQERPKISRHKKEMVVGSLFNLALDISISSASEKDKISSILQIFFVDNSTPDHISKGRFFRLNHSRLSEVKFDFRGMTINDVWFKDFDGLWNCDFDESTRWIGCRIENCRPPRRVPRKRSFGSFEANNVFDDAAKDFLLKVKARQSVDADLVKDEIAKFFNTFIERGNIRSRRDPIELQQEYHSAIGLTVKEMIGMCASLNLLETRPATKNVPRDLLQIPNGAMQDAVQSFLETRKMKGAMKALFDEIKNR